MRRSLIAIVSLLGVAGGAASAGETVFSNITNDALSGFSGVTPFDDITIFDDAQIVGGGELQSITVNLVYSGGGFGSPLSIDMFADVSISVDDGDGVLTPGSETPLWTGTSDTFNVSQNDDVNATLSISPGIVVPDNAMLWIGMTPQTTETSFVNFGTNLFNDFTVGSSNDEFFSFNNDTQNLSSFPSVGSGIGLEITVVPAPGAAVGLAMGVFGLAARRRR